tara:strand:+ start:148 stop:963 length:816 start_codon:yes stop_codon:yes gene_type:complete
MNVPNHNYPKIIYKYRSWDNKYHQKILTENQLYLASPKDFNDPFDCRIPNDYRVLSSDKKILEYVDGLIGKHMVKLLSKGVDIDKERVRMFEEIKSNAENVQSRDNDYIFKMQDKHFGVLSLSARWDSILMWSHYGDFHRGFCIGLSEEKLRKSGRFGKGGMVGYKSEFPSIDPRNSQNVEDSFVKTHNKAEDWSYEEEYRLTRTFFPDVPTNEDRTINFEDGFIEEIILGIKISQENKEEIIKIVSKKNVKVYQCYQVPYEFRIVKSIIA